VSAVLEARPPRLRDMTAADLPGVLAVERRLYSHPWSEHIFRDCLRVGYACRVYEDGGEIIGYGIMSLGAGECHILNLAIHPDHQRRGLGRGLLEEMLVLARRWGARMAFLEVRVSNTAAQRLYERAGFHLLGTRRDYYPAARGREDALVLARQLFADEPPRGLSG